MNKSFDLFKAEGAPPSGGAPKGASGPSTRLNPAPKTPGAATGGSGPQIVDCPLGAACPDGGRHQLGSQKLQKHTAQARQQKQTGQVPGDESVGKETGKPGVPPGAQNIGAVGSDQVQRIPPPVPVGEASKEDLTLVDSGKTEVGMETPTRPIGSTEIPAKGHDPDAPDDRKTLKEFPAYAEMDSGYESPASQRKTLYDKTISLDRPGRQEVPNPLVADESKVPPDSKPIDHYRLAQVARDSGDEELAKFHVGMARKRTEGMGSEDHRKLAEQLHSEGMHDHAQYHAGIHSRAQELSGGESQKTPDQKKKHESTMRDVHHEARTKANKDLEEAKRKHDELKAKADQIKEANAKKIAEYEKAQSEYEKRKAQGDAKAKPPKKPKLEKEPKIPEKPELFEPQSDVEKLRHETHTQRAKRVAENIESHLENNENLSHADRKRLEAAHKIAVFHANIGYTPTAAHKKELNEAEKAAGDHGKIHYDTVRERKDQKAAAEAAAEAAKVAGKQKALEERQQQKIEAEKPKPPTSNMDYARIADHVDKAKKLKANLLSHIQGNSNLSPEQKAKAQRLLTELEKHEQMTGVPTAAHKSELKELHNLAGEMGKKAYSPEEMSDESNAPDPRANFGNAGGYVFPMLHTGRALGTGLAASVTSPYGAAGHIGPQIISYGVTGATTAGHRLLHDAGQAAKDERDIRDTLDKEKEEQARRAKQAERVVGRGSQ